MSRFSDQDYLLTEQYHNASNLMDRIRLHEQFSTNPYGWMAWLFDQYQLPADAHILEVGCGPADCWHKNYQRIPAGWNITLSDFSAGMLDSARTHLGDNAGRFTFRVIDAQAIPYEDAHFDAVIANHMLYHVPDRPQALAEIQRVLKLDGQFFATTIGPTHLQEMYDLARWFDPSIVFGSVANPFDLENGLAQLEAWFLDVQVEHYPDSLVVTEVKPLVAFILSTTGNAREILQGDRLTTFITWVEEEFSRQDGQFFITKDSGIFKARRA
ncbi:MAG: class I SAM-dependent methyltransferase [Anaerolineaceae bacterium]|nr:class I SAM-dependent methyltransferase [Anaerolineaceae bacterium]